MTEVVLNDPVISESELILALQGHVVKQNEEICKIENNVVLVSLGQLIFYLFIFLIVLIIFYSKIK